MQIYQDYVQTCAHMSEVKEEIKTEEEILLGKAGGFLCPRCRKHFFYDCYFAEHVREHHLESNPLLPVNRDIVGGSILNVESMIHDTTLPLKLSHVNKLELRLLGQCGNYHSSDENVNHKCTLCSYSAKCESCLNAHRRIHNNDHPYKCRDCPYAAKESSTLAMHGRSHIYEKFYKHPEEYFVAGKRGPISKPQKAHNDDNMVFRCSNCPFFTRYKINFDYHTLCHMKQEAKKCSPAAKQKNELKQEKIKEDRSLYQCPKCPYSTKVLHKLKVHTQFHAHMKPPATKESVCIVFKTSPYTRKRSSTTHYPKPVPEHMKIFPDI